MDLSARLPLTPYDPAPAKAKGAAAERHTDRMVPTGGPGLEKIGRTLHLTLRTRTFFANKAMYTVTASDRADDEALLQTADVDRFMSSFVLL
jgi:hypothetical protein